MDNYDTAAEYVEHLVEHGKSLSDAIDHAFHRYGTDRDVMRDIIHKRISDSLIERGWRARNDS